MSISRIPKREDPAERKDLTVQRRRNKRNPYNEYDKPTKIMEKKHYGLDKLNQHSHFTE